MFGDFGDDERMVPHRTADAACRSTTRHLHADTGIRHSQADAILLRTAIGAACMHVRGSSWLVDSQYCTQLWAVVGGRTQSVSVIPHVIIISMQAAIVSDVSVHCLGQAIVKLVRKQTRKM